MNAIHTTRPSSSTHRLDHTLVGQLNIEWARLRRAASPRSWAAHPVLREYPTPAAVEEGVRGADPCAVDAVLLALIELAHQGEHLAGRTVLQLMLGKAVRIAASHAGRAERELLEDLAVSALWETIATYPVRRRPRKVAANLAMDTLHKVVTELAHTTREAPTEPEVLARTDSPAPAAVPADLELLEALAWGVGVGALSRADAVLLLDVYSPAPNRAGGAAAANDHGLSWAAARQRCSRAVRRLAAAVHADGDTAGVEVFGLAAHG